MGMLLAGLLIGGASFVASKGWLKDLGMWPLILASLFVVFMPKLRRVHFSSALRGLRRQRPGEGLSTFLQTFPPNDWSQHVATVVFEEVKKHMGELPLRATDRFAEDLALDETELVCEVLDSIASRLDAPLEGEVLTPYFGKIKTVGDLVAFFPEPKPVEPNNKPLHLTPPARTRRRRR